MNAKPWIDSLERSASMVIAVYAEVTDEQVRWKPTPERWSMLEVLAHLVDEERHDFRPRVEMALEGVEPWPSIDPEGWVAERAYNDRVLGETLDELQRERDRSILWLHGLKDPDWTRAYEHPQLGTLRAGDIFASWVSHDFAHLRQLGGLRLDWVTAKAEPYSTRYCTG